MSIWGIRARICKLAKMFGKEVEQKFASLHNDVVWNEANICNIVKSLSRAQFCNDSWIKSSKEGNGNKENIAEFIKNLVIFVSVSYILVIGNIKIKSVLKKSKIW